MTRRGIGNRQKKVVAPRRTRGGEKTVRVTSQPPYRRSDPEKQLRRPAADAYTELVATELLEEARKLNTLERLRLIEALWETLSEEDVPITAEERELLDARLADLEANPNDQSPWPEVKARLEKRQR